MNHTTAWWRPAVVTALSLPLALALSGTAQATGPAELPPQASEQAAISTAKQDAAPAVAPVVGQPAPAPLVEPVMGPQPLSTADSGGTGANPGGTAGGSCTLADPTNAYCSTRDGSASLNGSGDGAAEGQPCAGCVGTADNKNPQGQTPNGGDANAGYECDRNSGIGRTNPAHTGCRTTTTTITTTTTTRLCPDGSPMPPSGNPADCRKVPPPETPTSIGGGTPSQPVLGPPVTIVPNTSVPPTVLPPVGPPTFIPPTVTQRSPRELPFTGPQLDARVPLAGLVMLAGGGVLLVAGRRRTV